MSLFVNAFAVCGQCGDRSEQKLAASVNADRRPDLRQDILDGTFQAVDCPACGARLRLPVHLSFLDVGRGQWILAESIDLLPEWRTVEADAQAVFDRSYGSRAPPAGRELGAALRPRVVFGWPALRETLTCDALGLDPLALELLKLAMIRNLPGAPLDEMTELRLTAGGEMLDFAWVNGAGEQEVASISVGRDLYDSVVADQAPWSAIAAELAGRMFLDLRRLFLG